MAVVAKNDFSEAILNFKISVVEAIDGFGFVKNITPVETGFPTNIGIEIRNGSHVNVSVSFGDGSEPMWIVNIDNVLDIFVISVWHNYTSSGKYNVTITAQNVLNFLTASTIAEVQDPVRNLTIQVNNNSKKPILPLFGGGGGNIHTAATRTRHFMKNDSYLTSL